MCEENQKAGKQGQNFSLIARKKCSFEEDILLTAFKMSIHYFIFEDIILKIVTVLRSGGEYTAEHVHWFDKQLRSSYQHICLTDTLVSGVECVMLKSDWPGWFAKLELFDPELIDDDIFYIDLDTAIVGDIDHMLTRPSLFALRDFFFPRYAASGILCIPHTVKETIWQKLMSLSCADLRHYRGDGELLREIVDFNFLQDDYPGEIVSYKTHIAASNMPGFHPTFSQGNGKLPEEAKIVCFHGRPRPWQLNLPWLMTLSASTPRV